VRPRCLRTGCGMGGCFSHRAKLSGSRCSARR
jgi:hypothetical protein